jgi:putative flippase GtrA
MRPLPIRFPAALRRQILRYGAVGTLGFAVDAGLLYLLTSKGADPYYARVASFAAALTATWGLNRVWTFQLRGAAGVGRSYVGYLLVQLMGALTNYLVYAGVLQVIAPTPGHAVFALACGSALGLAVNFTGARMVFARITPG